MISQSEVRELYDYHPDGYLIHKKPRRGVKVGTRVGSKTPRGYIQTNIRHRTYGVHQLVWIYHYGEIHHTIDHYPDRTKSNNRIENLRDVGMDKQIENKDIVDNNGGLLSKTINGKRTLTKLGRKVYTERQRERRRKLNSN